MVLHRLQLNDVQGCVHGCDAIFSDDVPLVVALQFESNVQLVLQLEADDLKRELAQWINGRKVERHTRTHITEALVCGLPVCVIRFPDSIRMSLHRCSCGDRRYRCRRRALRR